MDWKKFKEDPYWLKIVEMVKDRQQLIMADIAQPSKTSTLLNLRLLQQELNDMLFIEQIPDLFIAQPDLKSFQPEHVDGMATDS